MKSFAVWASGRQLQQHEWWVVGKGPSFDRRQEVLSPTSKLLGLNDVCTKIPVEIAHVVDADALLRLHDGMFEWLVVPFYMHVNNLPATDRTITKYLASSGTDFNAKVGEVLRVASNRGRLLVYRSSLSRKHPHPKDIGRPIKTVNFSSEPAVDLLLSAGVRRIGLLGIDGGLGYSGAFSHLTPLTNGATSFDVQFEVISKLAKTHQAEIHHPFRSLSLE